jgi:large subunit ribosomal protein L6
MSRIGKKAIALPSGVKVEQKGRNFKITGPKGTLELDTHPEIDVKVEDNQIVVSNSEEANSRKRALHGTARALLNNMVVGVSKGFAKPMQIFGTGYNIKEQGGKVVLNVGFCHPVELKVPKSLQLVVMMSRRCLRCPDRISRNWGSLLQRFAKFARRSRIRAREFVTLMSMSFVRWARP